MTEESVFDEVLVDTDALDSADTSSSMRRLPVADRGGARLKGASQSAPFRPGGFDAGAAQPTVPATLLRTTSNEPSVAGTAPTPCPFRVRPDRGWPATGWGRLPARGHG